MKKVCLGLSFLGLILLTACGITVEPKTEEAVAVAPTQTSNPEFEQATSVAISEESATETPTNAPLPEPTATPTPPPEDTPTPEPSPSPVPTETPTPALPQITLNTNLNVRSGPDVAYERVGQLNAGDTLKIVGRNVEGNWWQISYAQSPGGLAWIADGYGETENVTNVPIVSASPPPITPTPTEPPPTPVPTTPPVDFVVKHVRLWTNEENGGTSPNGSVADCGWGNNIYVTVVDQANNPLSGVVISDEYDHKQITGSTGPGQAQYTFGKVGGFRLFALEDNSVDRAITSETSPLMSPLSDQIPIPWLIEAHYCSSNEDCAERLKGTLCLFHYSFDIVFQRTW